MIDEVERDARTLTVAEMKTGFFRAFGELMTLVEESKVGARCNMPLQIIDEVQAMRDRVMKAREDFLVSNSDTEDQWWPIVFGLVKITNLFDAIDADRLAEKSYILAAGASKILSVWKEEFESGNDGHH